MTPQEHVLGSRGLAWLLASVAERSDPRPRIGCAGRAGTKDRTDPEVVSSKAHGEGGSELEESRVALVAEAVAGVAELTHSWEPSNRLQALAEPLEARLDLPGDLLRLEARFAAERLRCTCELDLRAPGDSHCHESPEDEREYARRLALEK